MSKLSDPQTTRHPEYWSTLSQYRHDSEFQTRVGEEFFPQAKPERFFDAAEKSEEAFLTPVKRRTFLKLSAFAALAAALQGCERPVQKVLPYVNKPEEITYGVSNFYATTWAEGPESYGLLVASREGRPIKIEGNPDHPVNRGLLDSRGQASILDLYNPDRLRFPMRVNRSFTGEVGEELDPALGTSTGVLDAEIGEAIRTSRGKVVVLTRTVNGPSNNRLLADLAAFGDRVEHIVYDPVTSGAERESQEICFGRPVTPRYLFDKAAVVVCLGGDPLGTGVSPVEYQQDFAARRAPDHPDGMSRVYTFESTPTMTGMKADYRHAMRPDQILEVGLGLAYLLVVDPGYPTPKEAEFASNASLASLLDSYRPDVVAGRTGISEVNLRRVARALSDNPGRGIVYAGGAGSGAPETLSLNIIANLLNYILGNYEQTIDISVSPSLQAGGDFADIVRLCEEMKAGAVSVLIFQGVNPVYTLPSRLGFREGLAKVGLVVSLNRMMDETTALSDIVIPGRHGLECWGDGEAQMGVLSIQQPLIRPIFGELAKNQAYDTRGWQDSLMAFFTAAGHDAFLRKPTDDQIARMLTDKGTTDTLALTPTELAPRPTSWYSYIRETWRERVHQPGNFAAKDFETFWTGVLQSGVVDQVGERVRRGVFTSPAFLPAAFNQIARPKAPAGERVLVAHATAYHGDGASMANPFLLELPDPVSKVCWDNYAAIAPALAEELRVKDGDHVDVETDKGRITIPAYIQPGQHPDVVAVMLGWGRNCFGGVGDGIGVDVYPLTEVVGGHFVTANIPVNISRAGGFTELANVQGHNYLFSPSHAGIMTNKRKGEIPEGAQLNESGKPVYDRPIIGETTLEEWRKNPVAGYPNHVDPGKLPPSIWEGTHKYAGHHWGMVVDLNACTGCNACIVACSVENNVPVVGKDEVLMGREMHWMRIDRYYRGDADNPDFALMPLMCQHCDNAPCETVCPVIATMHNDEGLNVMTYNRCVGTRYCANNCPYKVRRFNFWQYSDYRTGPRDDRKRVSPLELVLNPDVTTRTRGVMEKCTFCVTRIRAAKEHARESGRPLGDGEMLTACQQTCPARAIKFGDRNDPGSEVAALWKSGRAYGLLEDLTTDPSVRYLTMVRNRDEPSPYRTKYQAHREDHQGDAGHGNETVGAGHGDVEHH